MEAIQIPLAVIESNPHQPRSEFDDGEMASLVASVKEHGILQPLLVTVTEDGMYVLIAGERRLRAAREAGLEAAPAVIMPNASEREQLELALIENVQRVDLNPIEKARAYQVLSEEFKLSHEEIAAKVGVQRSTVSNVLRLLKLPDDISRALLDGTIKERSALALLALYELPESLRRVAEADYYGNIKPSFIISQALQGALSSEGIRERVDELVSRHAKKMDRALWDLDYIFVTGESIHWPECRTCELRHKALNVCTKPECYEAKNRAWQDDYLQQAGQASGIQPLEPDISDSQIASLRYHSAAQSILTSGCENLRLKYSLYGESGPFLLADKGFPKAEVVCRKGNGHCSCLKGTEILAARKRREEVQAIQNKARDEGLNEDEIEEQVGEYENGDEPEPDPAQEWEQRPQRPTAYELSELVKEERKNAKEYQRLAKEAQERAISVIETGLESSEPGAWRLIYDRLALGDRWDGRPDDIIALRRGIAEKIVKHHVEYIDPKDVPDRLLNKLIEAGLQAPVFLE